MTSTQIHKETWTQRHTLFSVLGNVFTTKKGMGFCIDPLDRERNYGENRERLRGSERGQYLCLLVVGAQGVGGKRCICGGVKHKISFCWLACYGM